MFVKPSSKKKKIFLAFLIFALIVFSNIFQGELKNFIYTISSPFQKVLWQTGDKTSGFLKMFIEIKKTKEKLEELNQKNQKLTAEIAALKELRRENKILREALNINLQKNFKLCFAQTISKDISQDSILINRGEKDGISKGMPVINSQKVLLGKISQVYKNFSKVMLISNKKMSFGVIIQSADNVSGIAKGEGNSKILINLVPREKNLSKGNLVISDSLGGIFPKGLLVGKIKKINKKDTESFQTIEVQPAFRGQALNNLFIIIGQI